MSLLIVIFWICMAGLVHSYLLFPFMLRLLSRNKENKGAVFTPEVSPYVSILIAAYNEEEVIREKLESIINSNFSKEKIEVLVGSDASADKTDDIVKELSAKYPFIQLHRFPSRTGKIRIINDLVKKAQHELLVITDANVIFDKDTLFELTKHFKENTTGLVDTNMINKGSRKEGIGRQEKTYIQTEVGSKQAEGLLWGCMMGPFGGCYAVRKSLYKEVPGNFLVDDFFINMCVLEEGYRCINEVNAKVYEDVSNDEQEEFRRKVRIATGNFQNLERFFRLLFRFNAAAFCFFSHKVLRWIGPLLMISAFVISAILFYYEKYACCGSIYTIFFYIFCGFGILWLLDIVLRRIGMHIYILRLLNHFFTSNLAMLGGMFKYLGGVRSSVWEPTRRNQ
jgi:cellulose synthase/poly-beta-1,6-N-acetylglucosamine synthase-like glycosyltransferase